MARIAPIAMHFMRSFLIALCNSYEKAGFPYALKTLQTEPKYASIYCIIIIMIKLYMNVNHHATPINSKTSLTKFQAGSLFLLNGNHFKGNSLRTHFPPHPHFLRQSCLMRLHRSQQRSLPCSCIIFQTVLSNYFVQFNYWKQCSQEPGCQLTRQQFEHGS